MSRLNLLDAYYCGLEAVSSATLHITKDQLVLFANEAACALFGLDGESLTNMPVDGLLENFYSSNDHALDNNLFYSEAKGNKLLDGIFKCTLSSGEYRIAQASVKSVNWLDDDTSYVVTIDPDNVRPPSGNEIYDIIHRINVATTVAQIGIWEFNLDEQKLIWDDQMYELYGYNPSDFSGKLSQWSELLHPDDKD